MGGHIAQGETYSAGAAREAEEELGVTQPLTSLAVFYSDEGSTMQHMFGLFGCVAVPEWKFAPNNEVEQVIPMTMSDIAILMSSNPEKFTRGFINTFRQYNKL